MTNEEKPAKLYFFGSLWYKKDQQPATTKKRKKGGENVKWMSCSAASLAFRHFFLFFAFFDLDFRIGTSEPVPGQEISNRIRFSDEK